MKHANAVQVFPRAVVAASAGSNPVPVIAADHDGVPGRAGVGRSGEPVPVRQSTQTRDDARTDIRQIDEAYDRMQKSDVKYRFVIDNASLAA